MLKTLTYSVTFPTTGRELSERVDFKAGFGAITGPNESGKSMVIEMTRWLLFGTTALRGKADDYRKLTGELSLVLKGAEYRIWRSISNARLFRGKDEIAVGIRPVNDKIVQLLGFGVDVFDVACVANQGDLERLGSMKPTERKRMVDSVIGLGVIEDLAKSAGDDALSFTRRADDLKATLFEPTLPSKPDGYRRSEDIKADLESVQRLKAEYDQLTGWLASVRPEPVRPTCQYDMPLSVIRTMLEAQNETKAQHQALAIQLDALPVASAYTDAELDEFEQQLAAFDRWQEYARFQRLYPTPAFTREQLSEICIQISDWERFQRAEELRRQIAHLESHGIHTCPSCKHEWPVEADALAKLFSELEALPSHKPGEPPLTMAQVKSELSKIEHFESADFPEAVSEVEKPAYTGTQVDQFRRANAGAVQRDSLMDRLAGYEKRLATMPDCQKMLAARQVYEHQMVQFENDTIAYEAWKQERHAKLTRSVMLERSILTLSELSNAYQASTAYELNFSNYEIQLAQFEKTNEMISEFETSATDWKKAKEALTNLRGLVKQHLVPSLNKVASHLITQMTGGQRQKIEVDEDFNILVDDQAVSTLSGSGKAVANLALRLGLGQVLTNNVLSLFMGDEIDASMDSDRAGNTSYTLQTLKTRISQILLVTHKYPQADYYISLGTHNEAELT